MTTEKESSKRIALVLDGNLYAGIEAARAELQEIVGKTIRVTLSDIVRTLLEEAIAGRTAVGKKRSASRRAAV